MLKLTSKGVLDLFSCGDPNCLVLVENSGSFKELQETIFEFLTEDISLKTLVLLLAIQYRLWL